MAKQYDGQDVSFKAYDDMSSSEYLIVKMNGNDTVDVCSATTDVPLGVLQRGATTGGECVVRVMGHSKVKASEALTAGNVVSTAAAGTADAITVGTATTQYTLGIVTVGCGSDGDVAEILITHGGRAA